MKQYYYYNIYFIYRYAEYKYKKKSVGQKKITFGKDKYYLLTFNYRSK